MKNQVVDVLKDSRFAPTWCLRVTRRGVEVDMPTDKARHEIRKLWQMEDGGSNNRCVHVRVTKLGIWENDQKKNEGFF